MAYRPKEIQPVYDRLNTQTKLGFTNPYLSNILLTEAYEKEYDICKHEPNGPRLQSVAIMPAERVEPNSQLYSYINRFIDLKVDQIVPNITLTEFLSFPRDIVEELLRKGREKVEQESRLAIVAKQKADHERGKENRKRRVK